MMEYALPFACSLKRVDWAILCALKYVIELLAFADPFSHSCVGRIPCMMGNSLPFSWLGSSHYILRMMDPDRGFSLPAVVGGKKNKKGKIYRFSVKMAIFRGKKVRSSEVNPACRRKK